MGLQEEINLAVGQMKANLAAAQATEMPQTITIDLSAVRSALGAIQVAVVNLGGVLDLPPVPDLEISVSAFGEGSSLHLSVSAGLIEVLIDGSNFSGEES